MKIDRWMRQPVVTVKALDSIRHARELMEQHRFNQLPVVTEARLVGIVTDRDLRDAFPSVFDTPEPGERRRQRPDPGVIPVEDVMTSNVITLGSRATLAEAVRIMRRERIGAIPVVDAGCVVGILTRSDVLGAFLALQADGHRDRP